MPNADKDRTIQFGHLPKVEDLLKQLSFCSYSTQLRNTCYDIQYLYFLEAVLANDFWYGGFKTKLQYERLKTCFTIYESLLYCLLVDSGFARENEFLRFPQIVEKAYSAALINDKWLRKINNLKRIRNQHHANAQRDLQVKFDEHINEFNVQFIEALITELDNTHELNIKSR
jgi:hypothetical protein